MSPGFGLAVLGNGGPTDRIWHYNEEVLSGGGGISGSAKRGSLDSPGGHGDGAASSSFVALNLSLGRSGGGGGGDANSHDWVMVEAPSSNLQERGGGGSKVTISPSEEGDVEEMEGQPEGSGHRNASRDGGLAAGQSQGGGEPRGGDLQELSVETASTMPPVTPTSPGNGLPDEALTTVSTGRVKGGRFFAAGAP